MDIYGGHTAMREGKMLTSKKALLKFSNAFSLLFDINCFFVFNFFFVNFRNGYF